MRGMIAACLLSGWATIALAQAGLTTDQKSRLQAALDAQGCSGGDVRSSADGFDISGAKCGDQKVYDFSFDLEFKLLRKDARS